MKNAITITIKLLIITIVSAIALGAVNYITAGPIEEQMKAAALEARQSAFPEAAEFKPLYDPDAAETADVTLESLLGTDEAPKAYGIIKNVYTAYDANGNELGITAGVVTKGFNSGLNLTIGIALNGKITGVIVGDNTETAGLGAKASEASFEGQYTGKTALLNVVKASPGESDIQAITGATITTKGITNAVNTVAEFYAAVTGGANE